MGSRFIHPDEIVIKRAEYDALIAATADAKPAKPVAKPGLFSKDKSS